MKQSTLFVWGFASPNGEAIVEELQKDPRFRVGTWVGNPPAATHDVFKFFHFLEDYDPSSPSVRPEVYDAIYPVIHQFVDQMSRHDREEGVREFHDYLHIFNSHFCFFCDRLVAQRIGAVLFSNIPHEGADLVLYHTAKALGIPTLLFHQSPFPNRVFYQLEIGKFRPAYPDLGGGPLEQAIPRKEVPFYMRRIIPPRYRLRDAFAQGRAILRLEWARIRHKRNKLYPFLRSFLELHRPARRYLNFHRFRTHSASIVRQPDLAAPYIYFPFHLQPELTTSALGRIYNDMLLAVERLSRILPPAWKIYLKENPFQTEMMRRPLFYDRLQRIPSVLMVPPDTDTFTLIENSQAVAVITGTAGYEAIKLGKKAIVFGDTWYEELPGCFRYHPDFSWEEFLAFQPDVLASLEALDALTRKLPHGIVDDAYLTLVDDFDPHRNAVALASLISRVLERQPRPPQA